MYHFMFDTESIFGPPSWFANLSRFFQIVTVAIIVEVYGGVGKYVNGIS